jgi:hypothetical protein
MTTYLVQAILGDDFEDLYIAARNEAEAVEIAKQQTTLKSRWTRFVF